ncbi:MAG: GMC family oxidoreductase N-terminal domain-containing protein [Actinomycetota bacterium]|nr:GMC family oxidoreductase N-terminal domain-containing protein [Actinomycetota bacterium]
MQCDYVVVGTGSAGSVVANRLSADPGVRVVVLEAGPMDSDKFVHIPAAFSKLFRSPMDWDYLTEPQKGVGGREIYWPRGKVLGGSSSMNAMMWVPGFPADYDEWGRQAGQQWDYAHLRPYFDRAENGALVISEQRSPRSSTALWLRAAEQAGYRSMTPDAPVLDGFCQTAVTQRRGARWSCADAYLKPVLHRRNLTLLTDSTVRRVLIGGGRAVGVEFDDADGRRQTVWADREVVLSAGAVNTPQLLMLSGIGDEKELAEYGIGVVRHAPEVGRNLMDHLVCPMGFAVHDGSLFDAEKPRQLIDYLMRRRGMLTSNVGEAYGFVRSRPELELPDLELIWAPAPFFDEGIGEPYGHAIATGPILLTPLSRGTVTLRSADPSAKPVVDPRYLSDSDGVDRAAMMAGLRVTATIARSPALRDVVGDIVRPLHATTLDDETLERALDSCSHTLYHPVGTCRMGRDERSVVDPELRVRGVRGLRVADASVMPTIIRGHTHAPAVVIGEKAADLIAAGLSG